MTPGSTRQALIGPVLVMSTLVSSVISSFGAPLIPSIARDFHAPLSTAQWSLTAALLVGTICSPVLGRFGDGPRRREALLVSLAIVTVGGVVAASAGSLELLIVGRALQGVGLALAPLTMAIARAALPRAKVPSMIALLSVSSAVGLGAGYPISGWLADSWGLSGAYGISAALSGLTLILAATIIPASTAHSSIRRHDWVGTALLALTLLAVLTAVSEGSDWGWTSPAVIALLAVGGALVGAWVGHQRRAAAPLVQLRLLHRPAVLAGDACALALGVAMYLALTGVTAFVQTPRAEGFGFSATAVTAGLVLLPLAALMLASSRTLPMLKSRLGTRVVIALGCIVSAVGCAFFAVAHDALWQAFALSGFLGVGLGTTFAAIPGALVEAVPGDETGSAIGFYQVLRFTGFALGTAATATILTAGADDAGQPTEAGYAAVLWAAAGMCVLAGGLVCLLYDRDVPRAAVSTE